MYRTPETVLSHGLQASLLKRKMPLNVKIPKFRFASKHAVSAQPSELAKAGRFEKEGRNLEIKRRRTITATTSTGTQLEINRV